jgi:hypothetical protein
MTLGDLTGMCVTKFPLSATRPKIMAGLEHVIAEVQKTGLEAEIWIDGSFLTEKVNPEDSDIVVRITGQAYSKATSAQLAILDWLEGDLKPGHMCDSYSFIEYEKSTPHAGIGEWLPLWPA